MANRRTKQDYDNKYLKEHYKSFVFRLNIDKDIELLEHFSQQDNKNEYLKQLIAADMKKARE